MELIHTIVAMDSAARTIKEVFETKDHDKACIRCGELNAALKQDGRIAGYEIVSEPCEPVK